jgi:formylglycine-generating enzyme required for sulfatase activity
MVGHDGAGMAANTRQRAPSGKAVPPWAIAAFWLPVWLAACFALLAEPAAAQKKHAFVVGIDKYDNLAADRQLQKAIGDAKAISDSLSGMGFTVVTVPNVTRPIFNERWQSFLDDIKPGDTAAFVFSGHGVEINGANYLLPRDVPRLRLGRDEQLKRESLALAEILADLRERRPGFSLIVLDACRDNPFAEGGKTIGGTKGLARIDPPEGTFIMYSAGAHQTALDRLAETDKATTSVYTRTLVPLLKMPGLSLLDMADRLGEQVRDLAATISHRQTPAFYSGVIGGRRVCLAGCEVAVAAKPPPVAQPPQPELPGAPASRGKTPSQSAAAEAWPLVKDSKSIAELEAYVRRHGDTFHGDLAKVRLDDLKKVLVEQQRSALLEQQRRDAAKADDNRKAEHSVRKATDATRPGHVFRDCPEVCPEMVVLPTGTFTMGSSERDNQRPPHKVTIAKHFAVSKFTVTFAEWDLCVSAGACRNNPGDMGWGRGRQPTMNVSWRDISDDYLPWLSKMSGKTYRLLTEAEWEYAARAGTTTKYSWGDAIGSGNANCAGCGSQWDNKRRAPVGSFAASPFGLHDMTGNIFQWVQDCYFDNYNAAPQDGTAAKEIDACHRVARGGSSHDPPRGLRQSVSSEVRDFRLGFRLARSLDP